ncbi:hypothetical protein ES711_09620 [Gelidibacter salicanalis]|uniref:Uncharacterized protein n=1 Tax=Gelidibacter salicanalis TaxID=291193 RepID=A0A5C7AI82_9FLAO|nr:hypothetical protein [Gelidibacter salicanalis]TXE07694.1 hypothetical protein ES711_09620 [Gelidibacter salicanalis]
MMDKLFNIDKTKYASNLIGDQLRQHIEEVFGRSGLNFVGKFTGANEFAVYDKWTYITWNVPNFKRKSAYLTGKLIASGKGTLIKLDLKPNPVISVFPIITVLLGVISIIIAQSTNQNDSVIIFGLISVVVGCLFYLLGMFFRNRLKNNFKKSLTL